MSLRISAKDLGQLALDDFCPRCFWVKRKVKVPFQIPFPGIFSSIDSYTKKTVEGYFKIHRQLPNFIGTIGVPNQIINIHRKTFRFEHQGVILTGDPYLLFLKKDGTLGIVDYKTARYTENQDKLLPMYNVQLNGYALISESVFCKKVSTMHLVYFEPPHSKVALKVGHKNVNNVGFMMPFTSNIHKIDKDTKMVINLMVEAKKIIDSSTPPNGKEGCKECQNLINLLQLPGLK